MSILSNNEKLNLDKMIKASNAEDNTEKIKNLKLGLYSVNNLVIFREIL